MSTKKLRISRGEQFWLSGVASIVSSVKCLIVGCDICALPGQVAKHVVEGCCTISLADRVKYLAYGFVQSYIYDKWM